ncbi:Imm51 family immunity protein [Actinomyces ruminicola]|uniref:Immunity protein 51 n=1 Tax=Actinomyces ruminicola TaxID=332524 RepID=A0A1G9T7L4_9ACTO|nr:Imm51 family immunity protein [Actinomyces ruminicola]SDM43671.1 Immunity protein 51 [Actinomyces ruminicola]
MTTSDETTPAKIRGYVHLRDDSPEFGHWSCFFDVGGPQTANVVADLGHEPNGYFWGGVVSRLVELGELPDIETDPEGDMFCAYGTRPLMEQLAHKLTPYLTDPQALTELVTAADAAGFDFDD